VQNKEDPKICGWHQNAKDVILVERLLYNDNDDDDDDEK
jgi:hypothetical protein